MTFMLGEVSRYWLIFSFLILVAISALSLWPLTHLPSVPGSDKMHHLVAYAALMFPAALRRPKHWCFIALFFILWGGCIELLQPYVNRYGEWSDFLANSGGVLLGIVTATLLRVCFPLVGSK